VLTNNDLQYIRIPTDAQSYDPIMSFGKDPTQYTIGNVIGSCPIFLMMRHASDTDNAGGGSSAMNLEINPVLSGGAAPGVSPTQYRFNGLGLQPVQSPNMFLGFPPETYSLGLKYSQLFIPDSAEVNPSFEQRVFPLTGVFIAGVFTPNFNTSSFLFPSLNTLGEGNVFHFQKDATAESVIANIGPVPPTGFGESEDYLFSGAMVAPLDIQIQALLYAQERSFFVIPGYSFNQNPNDTRTNYLQSVAALNPTRPIYDVYEGANFEGKTVFPFYNEPMDVKITITGAITENYTASAGDQAAWIGKWGYIPQTHGSSGIPIPDQHIVNQTPNEVKEAIVGGLTFLYDPALPLPYQHASDINLTDLNTPNATLRKNRALRCNYITTGIFAGTGNTLFQTLPSVPKLPVCPGLLYFGPPDSPVVP
jgi:hypothetical protein